MSDSLLTWLSLLLSVSYTNHVVLYRILNKKKSPVRCFLMLNNHILYWVLQVMYLLSFVIVAKEVRMCCPLPGRTIPPGCNMSNELLSETFQEHVP